MGVFFCLLVGGVFFWGRGLVDIYIVSYDHIAQQATKETALVAYVLILCIKIIYIYMHIHTCLLK